MTIEEIPADELVVMTDFWHRAFMAEGCDPWCHACQKRIKTGMEFKLATVETYLRPDGVNNSQARELETREVMLCEKCTPADAERKAKKAHADYKKRRKESGGGCHRINGKIVH